MSARTGSIPVYSAAFHFFQFPEVLMAILIEWPTFKIKDSIYTIKMTFKEAYGLADKFDWNIIKLFLDTEATEKCMMRLVMDNEFTLDVLWYLIEDKYPGDRDRLLSELETAAALDPFRDALWSSVVLFSSPQLREILRQSWEEIKKSLKKFEIESVKSTNSSSPVSPEA